LRRIRNAHPPATAAGCLAAIRHFPGEFPLAAVASSPHDSNPPCGLDKRIADIPSPKGTLSLDRKPPRAVGCPSEMNATGANLTPAIAGPLPPGLALALILVIVL